MDAANGIIGCGRKVWLIQNTVYRAHGIIQYLDSSKSGQNGGTDGQSIVGPIFCEPCGNHSIK